MNSTFVVPCYLVFLRTHRYFCCFNVLLLCIDLDGSGTIEFDEYVRVMATYCMFTRGEILRFCFDCFDVDKSGTIDEKEFVELCR